MPLRVRVPRIAGGAGPGVITGNLSAVESGADALAAEGRVRVSGALSAAETGSDTLAAVGRVVVQGALAATETGADTFAASGKVIVKGALAVRETGADAASATGAVIVKGALAATESGADTFVATGSVSNEITGTLAATESGADTFAAEGSAIVFQITGIQARRLLQIHLLHGLGIGTPLEVSATARTAGALAQAVSESGVTVTVATTAAPTTTPADPGALIDELAALHGLTGTLTITAASRSAGSITQTLATAGGTTTVTRN
jgi:hypothetical protein